MKKYIIIAVSFVIAACSSTRTAPVENKSGFLGDMYSLMMPGKDDQAQLVYLNPRAPLAAYNKIMLAPVKVYRSKKSENLGKYSREDLLEIANKSTEIFYTELSKKYKMTRVREPGALLIELAITDADKSEPFMDTITSVSPYGLVGSGIKLAVTDKPSFVGEASGEGKVSDALTGAVLYAAVDRRVGGKSLNNPLNSWSDFEQIMQFWAERLSSNLCKQGFMASCSSEN